MGIVGMVKETSANKDTLIVNNGGLFVHYLEFIAFLRV